MASSAIATNHVANVGNEILRTVRTKQNVKHRRFVVGIRLQQLARSQQLLIVQRPQSERIPPARLRQSGHANGEGFRKNFCSVSQIKHPVDRLRQFRSLGKRFVLAEKLRSGNVQPNRWLQLGSIRNRRTEPTRLVRMQPSDERARSEQAQQKKQPEQPLTLFLPLQDEESLPDQAGNGQTDQPWSLSLTSLLASPSCL